MPYPRKYLSFLKDFFGETPIASSTQYGYFRAAKESILQERGKKDEKGNQTEKRNKGKGAQGRRTLGGPDLLPFQALKLS